MKKPLTQKKNLAKINKKYLFIASALIICFIFYKNLLIFGAITILSGLFSYYHDRINKTSVDFRFTFFLGIIITRHYGILYTLLFVILSNLIPTILAGGRIEASTFIFYLEYFALFSVVLFFGNINIITMGLILVVVDAVLGVIINAFLGIPFPLAAFSGVVAFTVRTIYFLTLGYFLEGIFAFF